MKTKFAIVDGQRREAERGLAGLCPVCGSPMIAKCGEQVVHHWAHKGARKCDHWWEPETEWHRNWKSKFPVEWQEIVHQAITGEKHIADVKTIHGHIIEFQNSYLRPEERRSREAFYGLMDWVVNEIERTRDKQSFFNALRARRLISRRPLRIAIHAPEGLLFRRWANGRAGVLFDFGINEVDMALFGTPVLWHLDPNRPEGWVILTPVPVVNFIEARLKGEPLKGIQFNAPERRTKTRTRVTYWKRHRPRRGPPSFEQYMARKHRARVRQRF